MVTLLDVWKPAREPQWKSLGVGVGAEEERGSDNLCCNTAFLPQELFFFILLPVLLQSASNRDVFWAQEPIVLLLEAAWSLRESWWLCTVLANCRGDAGRGEAGGWSAFPTGTEALAFSTFCSSTKVISLKETVGSSSEHLCDLTFCSTLRPCLREAVAFDGWTWGWIYEVRKLVTFVFS